jgi:hypothetical protein
VKLYIIIKFVKTKNIMADKILVVDDSFMNLSEKKSSSHNNKTKYVSPTELANLGNSGYTYTEVAITSLQIKGIGTTPVELLPAPGASMYHEFYGTVEYTPGAAGYTHTADMLGVLGESSYGGGIFANLIASTAETIVSFDHNGAIDATTASGTYYGVQRRETNEALIFTSLNGTDPTGSGGATGTLLVKLYYREKTFGTEL